ncbi:MAG: citryl-CoA lyase [Methanobacterium sp.]
MAIGRETIENMLKLGNPKWKTSITRVEPNRLTTRGYLQEDLIENISFQEMVFLLIKGEMPTKNQAKMLGSILVSFCDHGVTPPSTQAARVMASTGSPMHACVGGGLLAFGKHHAGAIENAMRTLQEGIKLYEEDVETAAKDIVNKFLELGEKVPGFGHRFHNEDPRAPKLIELAVKNECNGIHTELALTIQSILLEKKGIRMNIDGANGAILSDMGFDWNIGTGLFMIGRLPGIIAHVYEEKTREAPFRKFFDIEEIHYDGVDEPKPIN